MAADRPDRSPPAAAPVEVRTSPRRRKTASAFWQDGRVVVVLPAAPPSSRTGRDRRRPRPARPRPAPLHHRLGPGPGPAGRGVSEQYLEGVKPASIRWVDNQGKRWGSCTLGTQRDIRISDRLRVVPGWVLDAVIVHELAHLIEPSHSPRFRKLADRYPRMADERTRFWPASPWGLTQSA